MRKKKFTVHAWPGQLNAYVSTDKKAPVKIEGPAVALCSKGSKPTAYISRHEAAELFWMLRGELRKAHRERERAFFGS